MPTWERHSTLFVPLLRQLVPRHVVRERARVVLHLSDLLHSVAAGGASPPATRWAPSRRWRPVQTARAPPRRRGSSGRPARSGRRRSPRRTHAPHVGHLHPFAANLHRRVLARRALRPLSSSAVGQGRSRGHAPQAWLRHRPAAPPQERVSTAPMEPQLHDGWGPVAHGAPGSWMAASTAQRCPERPWGSSACSRRAGPNWLTDLWESDGGCTDVDPYVSRVATTADRR